MAQIADRSLKNNSPYSAVITREHFLFYEMRTTAKLLLKHIRQNNEVGTPFKELQQVLPGLNRNQIQVLMRELKEDGKVVCKGKTSAARWFIIK